MFSLSSMTYSCAMEAYPSEQPRAWPSQVSGDDGLLCFHSDTAWVRTRYVYEVRVRGTVCSVLPGVCSVRKALTTRRKCRLLVCPEGTRAFRAETSRWNGRDAQLQAQSVSEVPPSRDGVLSQHRYLHRNSNHIPFKYWQETHVCRSSR